MALLTPRIERAFRGGTVSQEVLDYGVQEAARRWGDARKALTLIRQAGETATDHGLDEVTVECIDENLETTDREATIDKLLALPFNHFLVLTGVTGWSRRGEIKQPVTTTEVKSALNSVSENFEEDRTIEDFQLGERAIRNLIMDLETMGMVETWIESRGREGRVKQIRTAFDPQRIREAMPHYIESSEYISSRVDQLN